MLKSTKRQRNFVKIIFVAKNKKKKNRASGGIHVLMCPPAIQVRLRDVNLNAYGPARMCVHEGPFAVVAFWKIHHVTPYGGGTQ